jgi:GDP-mannose 6-dehydrogenase
MKISIFGLGYVGLVSGACLARLGHNVTGVDVAPEKVDMINDGVSPIIEEGITELVREMVDVGRLRATTDTAEAIASSNASFVSVGTPSAANGSLSTEALEAVSATIGAALYDSNDPHVIVFRSTMVPGTLENKLIPIISEHAKGTAGEKFDVCYNPEFLREGSSIRDFENPPYTVVGAESERCFTAMEEIYSDVDAPFVRTGYRIAESVKYLSNIYHAVKICFANEVGAVLGQLDIDSREAAEIFMMDKVLNVSSAYLRPGFAFGGSCLPKDLRALLALARDKDVDLPMLSNILPSNQQQIKRAFDMIASGGRRRIAMFGLAFKSGTDDLRESPFVLLAETLIGKGYQLKIFDPNVRSARLIGANRAYIEREIPHFEELLQPDVATTLEDAEAIVIGHADMDTIDGILRHRGDSQIYVLQGHKRLETEAAGRYHGLCW